MLYLKAYKELKCGCIFHAYITYSHYYCRATNRCKICTYYKLEENEDLLCEEFNLNLPFLDENNYVELKLLGWIPIKRIADDNFKFIEDT